jgi:hypothetical protein
VNDLDFQAEVEGHSNIVISPLFKRIISLSLAGQKVSAY